MKITRIQLDPVSEEEYFMLAVVSADPDYKLSLSINTRFRTSLKSIQPIRITGNKGAENEFTRFSNVSAAKGISFTLVSNRSGKQFLVRKLKNVDFILRVSFTDNKKNIDQVINRLREIESITGVLKADPSVLNDIEAGYLSF